jgi:hypothetical protein
MQPHAEGVQYSDESPPPTNKLIVWVVSTVPLAAVLLPQRGCPDGTAAGVRRPGPFGLALQR